MEQREWGHRLAGQNLPPRIRVIRIIASIITLFCLAMLLIEQSGSWLFLLFLAYSLVVLMNEFDSTLKKIELRHRIIRYIRHMAAASLTLVLIYWSTGIIMEVYRAGDAGFSAVSSNYAQIALTLAGLTFVGVSFQKKLGSETLSVTEKKLLWASVALVTSAICFLYLQAVVKLPSFPKLAGIFHTTFLVIASIVAVFAFMLGVMTFLSALIDIAYDYQ